MSLKKCNYCRKWKDETEFNRRYKTLGIRNKACRDCQHGFNKTYYEGDAKEWHLQQVKERTEATREAARGYVYQYLLTHPWEGILLNGERCTESDLCVLEFHHAGKRYGYDQDGLRQMVYQRIQEEIKKCQVLCSNCHRRVLSKNEVGFVGKSECG